MSDEDTLVQPAGSRRARRRGRASLSVLSGRDVGAVHKLGPGESFIGRGADCDVQIVDDGVSRRHAKLVRDIDGTSKIFDLKSTNGTFVNGRRVEVEVLREGDRIRIGQSATLDFQFEYQDSVDGADDGEAREARRRSTPSGIFERLEASDSPNDGVQFDAALKAYRRTLRIREETFGPSHPAVAAILDTMGTVLRKKGEHGAALQHHRRAIEIYERRVGDGPEPPELAHLIVSLGEAELADGRPKDALATFERALVMLERRGAEDSELAGARFAIARSLTAADREPVRAKTLAQLAKEGFSQATGGKNRAKEVQNWIAALD